MMHSSRFLSLVLLLQAALFSSAQFTGFSVELVEEHDGSIPSLAGYSTYRVYAECTSTTDVVSALFGDAARPLTLSSPTGFWQSSVGSDFGSSINPGLFGAIPELEYDSWLTIGSESTIGAGSGISQVGMTAALNSFNNGGDLYLQAANGGSWFATFGYANAIAGDDLKVLVAQLTVAGDFNGSFNIQYFNGGVQANEEITEASCFSTNSNAVFGCTDLSATNYVEGSDTQCGTCTYPCSLTLDVNSLTPPSCFGENDGGFTLTQNGAQLGILYSSPWNPVPFLANASFDNLVAGSYTINAIDGAGCEASIVVEIEDPDPISVTASVSSPVSCNGESDGVISGSATGGTGAYTFSTSSNFADASDDPVFDGLGAGLYTIYVEDENGCTASTTAINLNNPMALGVGITATSAVSCANSEDGQIVVQPIGGSGTASEMTYSVDGVNFAPGNILNVGGGTYTVYVMDINGCLGQANNPVNIAAPPAMEFVFDLDTVGCQHVLIDPESFEVTNAEEPFLVEVNGEAFDLETGVLVFSSEFVLEVTDANGCSADTLIVTPNFTDGDGDGICDEEEIPGCTDPDNCNYNPEATDLDPEACLEDFDGDGICNVDEVMGCIFSIACNYDPEATDDDGSCVFYCPGCTNPDACNFDSGALQDDGSCELPEALCGEPHVDCACECLNDADGDGVCDEAEIAGCQIQSACNYNPAATDPAPCETTSCAGCVYSYACNYDPEALYSDGSCEFGTCPGCTNPFACNFNPTVSEDDGSCQFADECGECGGNGPLQGFDCDGNCLDINANSICDIDETGCTDPSACNFNPQASSDDGSCVYPTACLDCQLQCIDANENGVCDCEEVEGCMDNLACNFDPTANLPSASCEYPAPYFDCSGECLQDADSDGICDELESVYELGFNDGAESCNPAGCGESVCGNGTEWSDALEMCVPTACFGDFDADGLRGSSDLLLFLAVYGDVCPE